MQPTRSVSTHDSGYVTVPEVENRRRSLATKAGMRRARLEGRYMGAAPKGYENARDDEMRKVIVPSKDAPFVQEAFHAAALHPEMPMEAIRRRLWKEGFTCSRNRFTQILKTPLYALTRGGIHRCLTVPSQLPISEGRITLESPEAGPYGPLGSSEVRIDPAFGSLL
ncbi:MAG: hypothetical protein ACR2GR_03140 [Rhodothermales bacterium]